MKKSKVQGDKDGVESTVLEEVVREGLPEKVPFGKS